MKLVTAISFALVGCSAVPLRERPAIALPSQVTQRGETVYFGSSFPLKTTSEQPTFIYERRVDAQAAAVVSTHITREPSGAIAIVESATHSADYALADYTLFANQLGQTGSIHVTPEQVTFTLGTEQGSKTQTEQNTGPVVVGPTLVGFVVRRLDALQAGKALDVRFAVLDRLETIGFTLKAIDAPEGQARVKMSASNFIFALAIDPIIFTFDRATGKLVRLEGRVPPKVRSGNTWADFDARVEYRFVADAYR
ncbi:MAG: hypothetical protein Q8L14_24880 [Myxococcales bacterium]|nr:hypothetical protein [Myxococcales bacterium]